MILFFKQGGFCIFSGNCNVYTVMVYYRLDFSNLFGKLIRRRESSFASVW